MKPYPEYKETGLAWLPKVPSGWKVVKMKFLFGERSEKGFPNEPLLAATQNHGVILKTEYENRTVTAEKGLDALKLVQVGDFVISLRSFEGGIELAYQRGIISPAYTILVSNGVLAKGYFKYLGKSDAFIQLLRTCVTGIREGQNINYERLRINFLPVPPPAEQERIVAYLDEKTAKIDRLIGLKEREIELLNEKKQAMIVSTLQEATRDAVTIPLGKTMTLKSICGFVELPLLSVYLNLGVVRFDDVDEKRTNVTSLDVSKYQRVDFGDFVLNNQQAWRGSVGVSKQTGIISPAYVIATLSPEWDVDYANVFLRSRLMVDRYAVCSKGIGSIQRNLDWDCLKQERIPVPAKTAQRSAVGRIVKATAKIDAAVAAIEKGIGLLKERRTRLVSDAVTGRIDLREAVA